MCREICGGDQVTYLFEAISSTHMYVCYVTGPGRLSDSQSHGLCSLPPKGKASPEAYTVSEAPCIKVHPNCIL